MMKDFMKLKMQLSLKMFHKKMYKMEGFSKWKQSLEESQYENAFKIISVFGNHKWRYLHKTNVKQCNLQLCFILKGQVRLLRKSQDRVVLVLKSLRMMMMMVFNIMAFKMVMIMIFGRRVLSNTVLYQTEKMRS